MAVVAAVIPLLTVLSLKSAREKFRRGADPKMLSQPAQGHVIEISDDDDDDDGGDELPHPRQPRRGPTHSLRPSRNGSDGSKIPYRPRPPTRTALPRRPPRGEGGNGANSDDSVLDIDPSDSDSPSHAHRRTVLHQRRRRDHKAGNGTFSSATSSEDSGLVLNPPRTKSASQRMPLWPSSASGDSDAGYVTARSPSRQPGPAQEPSKRAPQTLPNDSRVAYKADQCPYYHDHELGVKMYRGEGYEMFPVVLGTVEGHKEICDKWDAHEANKTVSQDPSSADTGQPFAPSPSRAKWTVEDDCLQAVLQIFPDIEHEFVRNRYRQRYSDAAAEGVERAISAALVADIAELEAYPRQKSLKRKASPAARDETGVTIAWNKDLPKDRSYCREAIILLATAFQHIPSHYIAKIVKEKQSLFDAFGFLAEKESNFYNPVAGERPYKRLRQPRRTLEQKYQRKSDQRDEHQYGSMVNELQAARQHQAREGARIKRQKASDDLESENLAWHIAQGSMVECQCCFDEKPINRAVPCEGDQAHFFCNDCVKRQAESQVGALKYEMRCMDTSGCRAELSTEGVAQAIPLQLFDKLAFNQQQAEISLAGIQGLEMCPFCDFKAICAPVEVDSIFDCQNPDCGLVTCRKCKERAHLPKSCDEVKNDKGLGARHKVEEARSEAMMRTCPKCRVKLIKEYGCNKMICTNCYAVMCYVCQKDISGTGKEQGYDHFHRAGATCALHDQTGVDRHAEEANAAELAAIDKAKAEYEDIDEKALQIETGQNKKRSTLPNPPAVPPAPPIRGPPNAPFAPRAHVPPFVAMPQRDPAFLLGQMQQVLQPNLRQLVPRGHGQLPGQIPPDLEPLPLFGQQLHPPPERVAGPALPLDHGVQQRQALMEFLRHKRQNPI